MDPGCRFASGIMELLIELGLIIASSTAIGGITLGPAGLALGAIAGGAGATVSAVMQTSGWRHIASSITSFVVSMLPQLFSMEYITNMLEGVARLVVRLLRAARLLPSSEVHRAISYSPGGRRGSGDDGPGTAY